MSILLKQIILHFRASFQVYHRKNTMIAQRLLVPHSPESCGSIAAPTDAHNNQISISEPPISVMAWYVLAVFCVVYVMNFLDRTLIYILFPPIKSELLLSDFQLALLGTTSFTIFYTLLGIPFGRLADRANRTRMIAIGLAVWSLFSGLTGFASNFWMMFFCRVMVGVGEATLGPAALSLLSDFFPPRLRATVQSVYTAGIPLGAAAAFFLGGWIADAMGWRWAFILLGFPGILLALLVWRIPEPLRGATERPLSTQSKHPLPQNTENSPTHWRNITAIPALYFHTLGYAFAAIAANSLSIWLPSLLNRAYGMSLTSIGVLAGFSMLFAGGLATAFGGYIADLFKARYSRLGGGRMVFTMLMMLCCVPLWFGLLFGSSLFVDSATALPFVIGCYAALTGLGLVWLGPAAADVHDIVGPNLRGLGVGVYYFVVNIVGYGIAPPLIGQLSDTLGAQTQPEQMALALLVCPAACLVSAALLWIGSQRLKLRP